MALSRKTKKLLKGYMSWKALTKLGKFGAVPAAGMMLYRFWKDRNAAETTQAV